MTLGILDYNKLNMKIASIYGQSAVQWTMNAAVEPIFVGSTGIVSAFSLVSTAFPWSNSENPYFPASTIRARCVFLRHARVKHQNKRREITQLFPLIKQSLGNSGEVITWSFLSEWRPPCCPYFDLYWNSRGRPRRWCALSFLASHSQFPHQGEQN